MTSPALYRVIIGSSLILGMFTSCTPEKSTPKDKQNTTKTNKATTNPDVDPNTLRQNDGPTFAASIRRASIGMLQIPQGPAQTPLAVEKMEVNVLIVGRMARTEVKQVFRNHTNRRTEGTYSFTLPDGAALSRLAMTVGEKLVEGELVEREKARMIYESIVRRQKDPALLEWQGGNRFSTQVFPIEPKQTKTVVIAYDVLLPEHHGQLKYRYDLPKLDGLAKKSSLGDFSFKLQSEDGLNLKATGYSAQIKQLEPGGEVSYTAKNFRPGGPLEVNLSLDRSNKGLKLARASSKSKHVFLADVVPEIPKADLNRPRHLVIALDTSAGLGQPVLDRAISVARGLIEKTPETSKLQVLTGDYKVRACGAQPVDKTKALSCLDNLSAGGATNLHDLLTRAAKVAADMPDETHLVVLTDGVASIGEMDGELIQSKTLAALSKQSSLHTIAIGHSANEDGLRKLARAARGQSLRMTPKDDPAQTLTRLSSLLNQPLLVDMTVEVLSGNLSQITPNQPINVAHGESIAIMGLLPDTKSNATIALKGTYQGKPWQQTIELPAQGTPKNALLPRFWARKHIDVLQKQDAPRADIVKLSKTMGVLSPYTSFLVLESDEAFKKYKIEQEQARIAKLKAKQKQDKKDAPSDDPEEVEEESTFGEPEATEKAEAKNLKKGRGSLQDAIKDSNKEAPKPAIPDVDGKMADEIDVKNLGTNKAIGSRLLGSKPLKNIFKSSDGFDSKMNIAAGSKSGELQIGRGSGGLGMRGAGQGGGGEGFGRIGGLGKVDTGGGKGFGGRIKRVKKRRKPSSGSGYGRMGLLDEKHAQIPRLAPGKPVVMGSMDKNIIRRIIQRKKGAFKYCYQKELLKNPYLKGKISIKFTISGTGQVISATTSTSTMQNPRVENCITRIMRRTKFPATKGGGIVIVKYPFIFDSGRGDFKIDNTQRIKELESRKKTLKRTERTELLELYTQSKQTAKAKAWFKALQARIPKDKMPQGQLELLRIDPTRSLFFEDFADALQARLKLPEPPTYAIISFVHIAAQKKADKRLIQTLGEAKLTLEQKNRVFQTLASNAFLKPMPKLFDHWKPQLKTKEQDQLLSGLSLDTMKSLPGLYAQFVQLRKLSALDKKATATNIMNYINLGFAGHTQNTPNELAGQTAEAALHGCALNILTARQCGALITRYKNAKIDNEYTQKLQQSLQEIYKKQLQKLKANRAEDMANRALIMQMVQTLDEMGNADEAARTLSEMVEFAPHDYTQRLIYGHKLVNRKQIVQGCDQYATAVQLNPSKRDTFRTMMRLRRSNPTQAKAIRECIVKGVSRLPVKRAVSIILTWETPTNDVDLHIREAGKEHISFQKRESSNGGLLYYDITDGYGPEIYVLGSGPAGTYPVSLVYYSGMQRDVRGTVTILRDAGSPEESRRDIPFVLPRANTVKEYPIGQFILTERDKSGDKSKFKQP